MPKSPLSAPGGSDRRNKSYEWGTRDRRQNSGHRGGGGGYGGYGQSQGEKYECIVPGRNDASPQSTGDDFIPLGFSSPVDHQQHQRSSGNWRGQRRGRGGFNQQRYSFNDSNSPKFFNKHQFSPRGHQQKNSPRQVDISAYVDVKSMLEDPWADLVTKLQTSKLQTSAQSLGGRNNDSTNPDASGSSCGSILMGNLTVDSNGKNSSSESQESQIAVPEKSETNATPNSLGYHSSSATSSSILR